MVHHGKILKKAIKSRGFTQESFADKIGLSRATVARYFYRSELDKDIIDKVCSVLDLNKNVFYEDENLENILSESESIYEVKSALQECRHELEKMKIKNDALEKELKLKDEVIKLLKGE